MHELLISIPSITSYYLEIDKKTTPHPQLHYGKSKYQAEKTGAIKFAAVTLRDISNSYCFDIFGSCYWHHKWVKRLDFLLKMR